MNIIHILHEFPFPANSGIRCDMGRRLAAFRKLGHRVFAVAWASVAAGEIPSPAQLAEFEAAADETALIPISDSSLSRLRRIWNLRRYPSYIASRIPTKSEQLELLPRMASFEPDLVWLEGVHPSWLAWEVCRQMSLPLAYRAHNVEHLYVAEQSRLADSFRQRLALRAGTWGLEKAERRLHAGATRVFDISTDDLAYWQSLGFCLGEWLASQPDPSILATATLPNLRRDIDLLFIGSLSSPNNVAGLRWFSDSIAPLIRAELPNLKLVIAGRNPGTEVAHLIRNMGAELIANPPKAADLFGRAKVMLNPILHGSGVNIKTIDMLATGRAVITTSKGARGLPYEIYRELYVADTAAEFSMKSVGAVREARRGRERPNRQALVDRYFGIGAVEAALAVFSER